MNFHTDHAKENRLILGEKAAVIAFAFSTQKFGQNRWISETALKLAAEKNADIFTQGEFLDIPPGAKVDYVNESFEKPAPTLRIALEAVRWAEKKMVSRFFVVAAPPHLRRCLRDLKYALKLGKSEITLDPYLPVSPKEIRWFTKDTRQARTRFRFLWYLREVVIFLLPWLYRKLAR